MSDDPLNDNPLTDREAEALAAELGIEFSKTPLCLHFGQKASEPRWGEVEGRICRGHVCKVPTPGRKPRARGALGTDGRTMVPLRDLEDK